MGKRKQRSYYWWIAGQGPLSPFADIPWASIVTLVLWLVMGLTGREGPLPATTGEIVWAWAVSILAYIYYLYKIVENAYVVFNPELWWVYRYLSPKKKRKILETASLWDLVDLLFLSAYAANGLFMNALFETVPATILGLPPTSPTFIRLLRISPMIAFAGFGTGFTDIVPTGPLAVNIAYVLGGVQVFTAVVIGSNLSGISASRRTTIDV